MGRSASLKADLETLIDKGRATVRRHDDEQDNQHTQPDCQQIFAREQVFHSRTVIPSRAERASASSTRMFLMLSAGCSASFRRCCTAAAKASTQSREWAMPPGFVLSHSTPLVSARAL